MGSASGRELGYDLNPSIRRSTQRKLLLKLAFTRYVVTGPLQRAGDDVACIFPKALRQNSTVVSLYVTRTDGVPRPFLPHEELVALSFRVVEGRTCVEGKLNLAPHVMAVDHVVVGTRGAKEANRSTSSAIDANFDHTVVHVSEGIVTDRCSSSADNGNCIT